MLSYHNLTLFVKSQRQVHTLLGIRKFFKDYVILRKIILYL